MGASLSGDLSVNIDYTTPQEMTVSEIGSALIDLLEVTTATKSWLINGTSSDPITFSGKVDAVNSGIYTAGSTISLGRNNTLNFVEEVDENGASTFKTGDTPYFGGGGPYVNPKDLPHFLSTISTYQIQQL